MTRALIAAGALLVIAMAGAWLVQRRTGNSGWIDATWSLSVGVSCLVGLWLLPADGSRPWLLAGIVALWSARLGGHIVRRASRTKDDPRYAKLMEEWGSAAPLRLFMFLQIQALAGTVLALAVLLAASGGGSIASPLTAFFAVLAIISVIGEGVADHQLASCKQNPPASGVCDAGLWSLSRHPNYFFEWLFWVAVAGLAIAQPVGLTAVLALAAPAMMYWLLRYASGVPHLEAHMRRTRPEAFAQYAARVPEFFPRLW